MSSPIPLSLNHHLAFVVDPADATHVLLGDAGGGEGIFTTTDGGGVWVVANDGLFAQQIDFALKSPAGYRYAANRTGFVYFGGAAFDAPWIRVYRAKDVTKDPVSALAYDSADNKRVVVAQSNLVDQAALLLLPDATNTGEDGAPFVHSAWSTLAYPDNAKAPIFGLLVDGMTIFAGIARSQNAATGQYLYRSVNGGTSWALTSLNVVGGVRALAFDSSKHTTIFAGPATTRAACTASRTPAACGSRPTAATTGRACRRATHARRRIAAHHRRRSGERHARLGVLRQAQQHQRHRRRHLREPRRRRELDYYHAVERRLRLHLFRSRRTARVRDRRRQRDVYVKQPGNGSDVWSPGFGVYGDASVLYAGSVGVGTATGLYEASGVMLAADDMGNIGKTISARRSTTSTWPPAAAPARRAAAAAASCRRPARRRGDSRSPSSSLRLLFRRRGGPARPRA